MYAGGRRPYDETGGSEDYDAKKRKTENTWEEQQGVSTDTTTIPTPSYTYGDTTSTSTSASVAATTNVYEGTESSEGAWKMMSQYDTVGTTTASSTPAPTDWSSWGSTATSTATGYGGDSNYTDMSSYSGGTGFEEGSNWGGGEGGRGGRGNRGNGRGGRGKGGNTDFSDDMAIIKEAEMQYKKQGTVDFDKIKKALQMVSQHSDGGRGKRGGWRRGGWRGGGGGGGYWGPMPFWGPMPWRGRGGRGFPRFRTTPYDNAAGFGGRFFKPGRGMRGFRGGPRGGRGGRGWFNKVAPVHSLSKVSAIDPSTLSDAEKIRRFALFIQNDSARVNDIQTIENALTGSKLGLKADYQVEELLKVCNKMMYTGRLFVGGVFLARAVGANKKEVKHECFRKAVDTLKEKTVAQIMKLEDVGTEKMREELVASLQDEGSANPVMDAQRKVASMESSSCKGGGAGLVGREPSFEKLIDYLKSGKANCSNVISELTQAFSASFCNLSHRYREEDGRLPNGKLWFRGQLMINDTLMAAASGHKKKETKLQTFEKAMTFLKTKPIDEIIKGVTLEEADEMPICPYPPSSDSAKEQNTNLPNEKTLEKLTQLMNDVPEFPGADSVVNLLDVTLHQLLLVPTCIYRRGEPKEARPMMSCDLYLDNILISVGEGEKRKEAQCDCYTKALEVLSTSTPEAVFNEFTRLTPEDTKAPNVMEVWVKGTSRSGESNMQRLKRMKYDPYANDKTKNDIVLIEHHEWAFDRKRQAFCILNMSCTQNAMLLEWKIHPVGTFFKCEMFIQQEKVGEACAPAKNAARNLAAADALFKLYQTQTTIKVTNRDETDFGQSFETIKERAEALKAQSGEGSVPDSDDLVPVVSEPGDDERTQRQHSNSDGESTTSVNDPLMVNKWFKQVYAQMIEEFAQKESLEELIFGTGFTPGDKKQIVLLARKYDLRYANKQTKDVVYSTVYRKYMPDKMEEILKNNDGRSGKYSIVPKDLLPKHSDIDTRLMATVKKTESFDTSGEYETAHSEFFESPGQTASKSNVKSPFSSKDKGNSSFQTSTPRDGRGKRGGRGKGRGKGRGRGKGSKVVAGNVDMEGDWDLEEASGDQDGEQLQDGDGDGEGDDVEGNGDIDGNEDADNQETEVDMST